MINSVCHIYEIDSPYIPFLINQLSVDLLGGQWVNSAIFSALMYWAVQRLVYGSDSASVHHPQGELREMNFPETTLTKSCIFISAMLISAFDFSIHFHISLQTDKNVLLVNS